MQKKKIRQLALALTITLGISTMASGCTLVSVNPEKDNQQVVAEVDGQPILKENFNNYMAYYDLYYTSSGSTMPTGSKLTEFKKDILDSLVQTSAMAAQAKKDKLTVDEAQAETQAKTGLESLKTSAGNKYESVLKKYNSNNDAFTKFMKSFMIENAYASECYTKRETYLKEHPEAELDQVVGKVGGEDVKKGWYNYFYINEEMNSYASGGKGIQTDEASQKVANESIFNAIAQNKAILKYCEDNKLEIKQEAIDAALATKQSIQKMMFKTDEELAQYLEGYTLTKEKYEAYQKDDAKAAAAEEVIQKKLAEDVKYTENDLRKYYKDNKDTYDESKVSAQHILATDENVANEIYEKAKNVKTKEEFEKIMNEYKTNEKVKEATDLGSFNKAKMVKEFSDMAFSMDKNTVSKPVKTQYGSHVIFVYDKTDSASSFESKKEELTSAVKEKKSQDAFEKLKADLIAKEKIEIQEIKTPIETYMEQLKKDLNIKVHDNTIK